MKNILYLFFSSYYLCVLLCCNTPARKLDWVKIINKYSQKKEDTLYLQAALFLKENMNKQFSEQKIFFNEETGKEQDIYTDTISSYASWLHLIEQHHLQIKKTWVADSAVLTNNLLEENIEDAVNIWKDYPKNNNLSLNWQLFLEYVLPYKILKEYPQRWRSKIRKRFNPILNKIEKDSSYEINVIDTLNNDIKKWFAFNLHNSPSTWAELSTFKNGDCIAISSLMAFAGRSYGIPVAIDYCPVWANINGSNHYWNSLLRPDKRHLPFMGAESNPKEYNPFLLFKSAFPEGERSTFKKCGKVFRYTFSINKKNIRRWIQDDADIPYTLAEDRVIDVTREYYAVKDIAISIKFPTTQKIAYLCVFNKGEWIPTAWDTISDSREVLFKDIATSQLYLPAFFSTGTVMAFKNPFIAGDSTVSYLEPDKKNRTTIKIKHLQSIEQEQINLYNHLNKMAWEVFEQKQYELAAGKSRTIVKKGNNYSLYYWDKEWIFLSRRSCQADYIAFKNVPGNCLYKITGDSSLNQERVFTYQKGVQHWW